MENPLKMDDLGVSLFLKHPNGRKSMGNWGQKNVSILTGPHLVGRVAFCGFYGG